VSKFQDVYGVFDDDGNLTGFRQDNPAAPVKPTSDFGGVPAGGTTDQGLRKASAAAGDAGWADAVWPDRVNNFAKAQTCDLSAVAYAASITLDRDTHANHINVGALTGNLTIENPTGYTKAVTLNVWLTQDAVGGRTLAVGNKVKKGLGIDLTLSAAANAVDLLLLTYNPTKDIWVASLIKGIA
jgi:hypothetical protein